MQEEGIADLNLVPWTLTQGMRELATEIQRRFGLAQDTRWAVPDPSEQCLASGAVLPGSDEMARLLAVKSLQSPIRALGEFLKERPDYL